MPKCMNQRVHIASALPRTFVRGSATASLKVVLSPSSSATSRVESPLVPFADLVKRARLLDDLQSSACSILGARQPLTDCGQRPLSRACKGSAAHVVGSCAKKPVLLDHCTMVERQEQPSSLAAAIDLTHATTEK